MLLDRSRTVLAATILASVLGAITIAAAQTREAYPDFSSNFAGWVGLNGGGPFYEPVPGRLPPVVSDPAHPFVPNGAKAQPTFRIADLTNPNLKPWVKERMKQDIDEILAGKKSAFTPQSSCVPAGVPFFMGYGGPDPIIFLQTPKVVWMIWREDNQVRRIYMDVPHSANPTPSWYGESVGHYEGDTLVVDTIGFNDRTFLDSYRTPHTDKLHVVERFRLIDGGNTLEVAFTVEDPGAFYQPWSGTRNRHRAVRPDFVVNASMLPEEFACPESNDDYFNLGLEPIPTAEKKDF